VVSELLYFNGCVYSARLESVALDTEDKELMGTKTWDSTVDHGSADWIPPGDPGTSDCVHINGGIVELNSGDAGFSWGNPFRQRERAPV
jgi:hypothetical protein